MVAAKPDQQLSTGAVLCDTYRLVRTIGAGGMGQVWLAQHLRLPKDVAVKFLQGAMAQQKEANVRFRREAEISAKLRHPTIVEILDYNVLEDGTPFLVMEYLEGESLRLRMERGPIHLDEATAIASQISAALSVAHQNGVVHRDLKPENVFLCSDPLGGGAICVKVLDFGISKMRGATTSLTNTSSLLGTPQYMSPEQARGAHAEVDGRADQFALAAIVFEMLTGRPAFPGETLPEVIHRVVYDESPTLAGHFPDHVVRAVATGLSKTPEQRFKTIALFSAKLSGQPVVSKTGAQPVDSMAETAFGHTEGLATQDMESGSPPENSPTARTKPHSARRWLIPIGVVISATVAFSTWKMLGVEDDQRGPTRTPAASGFDAATPAADATTQSPDAGAAAVSGQDAKPQQARQRTTSPNPLNTSRGPVDEPSARQDVLDAYELLRSGHMEAAERQARRALQTRASPAVFALLTTIACHKGDQVNAFAFAKRVPKKRHALYRRMAIACRQKGISVE